VKPDPTDENVRDGLALLRKTKLRSRDWLGGGSPMDAAKSSLSPPRTTHCFASLRVIIASRAPACRWYAFRRRRHAAAK